MFSVHSYRKLQSDPSRSNPTKPKRLTSRNRSSNSSLSATSSRLPPVPEQPKTKKALTMKVKELRSWLSELGDKNQEHYHRFHNRSSPKAPPSSSSKAIEEGDDFLGIQSKPSIASSCPSTAILEDNNDPLFAASFSSDEDNSSSGTQGTRSDLYQRNDESPTSKLFHNDDDEGVVEHISTKDHLKLLLKQAPRTQDGCSYAVGCADSDSYQDGRDDIETAAICGMRKSPLFRDQILTKATLDAMSGRKTLGDHLETLKEKHCQQKHKQDSDSEKDAFYQGDDEGDSKSDSSSNSTDSASIGPSVLVSKMANTFLNNHSETLSQAQPPVRRKFVDPRDLSFLRGSSDTGANDAKPREDLAYANPPRTPTTTVGKGIRKFGGPRKSLVERRTEELHQKFGETRSAVFVQKKTWGQKTPHGKYQRTTKVEKVYK